VAFETVILGTGQQNKPDDWNAGMKLNRKLFVNSVSLYAHKLSYIISATVHVYHITQKMFKLCKMSILSFKYEYLLIRHVNNLSSE